MTQADSVLSTPPTNTSAPRLAALGKEIENLKNSHDEEKFLWFLASLAVFDVGALLQRRIGLALLLSLSGSLS